MSDCMAMICIKGSSQQKIAAAISASPSPAFLSPKVNGWVCLYQQGLATCDLGRFGATLFKRVGAAGTGFKIVSSSYLFYWVFDSKGNVIEWWDCENELGAREFSDDEMNGVAGGLERLSALGPPTLSVVSLKRILRHQRTWRRENLARAIRALGIAAATCDFADIALTLDSDDGRVRRAFRDYKRLD